MATVDDVAAHEDLVGDLRDLERAVLHDREDAVEDGALVHELVLAPVEADEALLAVDVEALVGGDDRGGVDLLDLVVAGAALDALAVLFLEHLEPLDGVAR